jgi:pyrroloquinoline quinone biosynthesis protein B
MKVRVLGSAAGGGIPQWNCACDGCTAARDSREGGGTDRRPDTVAVSGDGIDWYLLNASPDLRAQLLATPELRPGPGRRQTPVRGVILTTAELDHTAGLLGLREASSLNVYATATVLAALSSAFPVRTMLAPYTAIDWREMPQTLPGGLCLEALTVGAKRPRYASSAVDAGGDWVTALRITDERRSAVFVYATCLPAWTEAFDDFVRGADVVLLDGTFATADELAVVAGRGGAAGELGHVPVAESEPATAGHPGTTFWYGHLNNTNPMARGSPRVVEDGQLLVSS